MNETKEILNQPKSTIEIVYAGGTISSLATPLGYREGGHVVDLVGQLEQRVPTLQGRFELGKAEIAYTGLSENIDEDYWRIIEEKTAAALARSPTGIVITHGTDSMEQTARYLQTKFGDGLLTKKTKIILTGANDDLSTPNTDAWDNLTFAFESVDSDVEPGVYVAFHGKLIPAALVVKEPFNGVAMNYTSRNDLAYEEAVIKMREHTQQLVEKFEDIYKHQKAVDIIDYAVNTVRLSHLELLDYVDAHQVRGILLTLYHSGTANTEKPELSVAELATKLRAEKGITMFAVTENGESVNFGAYETSLRLQEAGIVPLGSMPHDVALAKLQLLDPTLPPEMLIQEMLTDKVGELK